MPRNRCIQLIILLVLMLAACTGPVSGVEGVPHDTAVPPAPPATEPAAGAAAPTEVFMVDLPDLGPAPEFKNETWLNVDDPVTLASLRGKVVLLEFWTFG